MEALVATESSDSNNISKGNLAAHKVSRDNSIAWVVKGLPRGSNSKYSCLIAHVIVSSCPVAHL
jgi:hypothetical protein